MSEFAFEPYVILERGGPPPIEVPAVRRRTTWRLKRAILLVDRPDGLDHPLAAEGFEVYRTMSGDSGLDLLRDHPSIVMALVGLDLPSVDAPALIRNLRQARPGLWIAMLGGSQDRERAAAGFQAGAVDWFRRPSDPQETVARLVRTIPWALRVQEKSERGIRRQRVLPGRLGFAATLAFSALLGIALAAATRSWHETVDPWAERIERILATLEADRADRRFDRWSRQEQLNLMRERAAFLRAHQTGVLEEQRAADLLRAVPPPRYPTR